MRRLIKQAANEQQLIWQVEYREDLRGFRFTGTTPQFITSLLQKRARVIDRENASSVWLMPEIYWQSLVDLWKKHNHSHLEKALSQFKVCTRRYDSMHLAQEPIFKQPCVTPTGTVLRSYQVEGIRALYQGNLLLADQMGTGKTLMMLYTWYLLTKKCSAFPYRLVVFTPNEEVADDWINEGLKRHIGGNYCAKVIRSRANLGIGYADITLIPYSKIWRPDYDQYLRGLLRGGRVILVLDEGHVCSAITSHQHRAAYEYAQLAERVWIATGTECRNPREYYGIYRLSRSLPQQHTTEEAYVKHYRDRSGFGWDEERLAGMRVLRRMFAIRRTKADVCKELPPYTAIRVPCRMHPIQEELYRQMEKEKECEVLAEYGTKELSEKQFLTVYLRLMQLASHPINVEETRVDITPKLDEILRILEGAGEQKTVVWSNWPKTLDYLAREIKARMPGIRLGVAHGGIDKGERTEIKKMGQAGELDLILANPRVWSTGINLQRFSITVWHDHHPSSVQWEQSRDRLHRMGQQLPVTGFELYHINSIEVRILSWLKEKKKLAAIICGT